MRNYKNIANEILSGSDSFSCRVSGSCMSGVLSVGDELEVASISSDELCFGDIVVVKTFEKMITHRFYGIVELHGKTYLLTKGDAFRKPDPLWDTSGLLGIVVAVKEKDGSKPMAVTWARRLFCHCYFLFWKLAVFLKLYNVKILTSRMDRNFLIEFNDDIDNFRSDRNSSRFSYDIAINIANKSKHIISTLKDYSHLFSDKMAVIQLSDRVINIFKDSSVIDSIAMETAFKYYSFDYAIEHNGICIHASAIKFKDKVIVFAGPSGTGKTTCREKFSPEDRLDDDFVLVIKKNDSYFYKSWSPFTINQEIEIHSFLLPVKSNTFALKKADTKDAIKYLFNLPPERRGRDKDKIFKNACDIIEKIKVNFVEWSIEDNLPHELSNSEETINS